MRPATAADLPAIERIVHTRVLVDGPAPHRSDAGFDRVYFTKETT